MRTWKPEPAADLLRCDADAERAAGRYGRCRCYGLAWACSIFGKALWNLLAPLHGEGAIP